MAGVSCLPFRVHNHVHLPPEPRVQIPKAFSKNEDQLLAEKIGKIKTQTEFPKLYQTWIQEHPTDLNEAERFEWLHCLYHYVKMDSNGNGIPDWSAIVDHQPSKILFPEDPDQDGDGIVNIFDSNPLNSAIAKKIPADEIPPHLKMKRSAAALIQEKIFREFSIIAVDSTDEHSPVVLRELLSLLEKGFSKSFHLKNLRTIYAFAGHDPARNSAAYHWRAQALSIGGVASYRDFNFDDQSKVNLFATLAHEIGHAILFEKLSAEKLVDAAEKFAGWSAISSEHLSNSFFSKELFKPYSLKPGKNIVSQYSMRNRHEWFAETFASAILHKIGQEGALGENWKKLLAKNPAQSTESWTNYNNITDEFCHWLELLTE